MAADHCGHGICYPSSSPLLVEIVPSILAADFARLADEIAKVENATVAGWDDHEVYAQRIRNYTAKPIQVEVRRTFPGHVVFRSKLEPTLHDYQTPQFQAKLLAGATTNLLFEIVRSQGYLAKQNNVTLAEGLSPAK